MKIKRKAEMLDSLLYWVSEHDSDFVHDFIDAAGMTLEEAAELELIELPDLPKEYKFEADGEELRQMDDDEITQMIDDTLSDAFGWCTEGYQYEVSDDQIVVTNIVWDLS